MKSDEVGRDIRVQVESDKEMYPFQPRVQVESDKEVYPFQPRVQVESDKEVYPFHYLVGFRILERSTGTRCMDTYVYIIFLLFFPLP
jgi:hypothetical protein